MNRNQKKAMASMFKDVKALALDLKILIALNRMNQETQHVDAILLIGFDQKCMKRRSSRTGVNLGFYCRQAEVG
jgi:hypothetical protein